jgi:agmatinase
LSQQPAAEYLRHGQTPFFRLPMADLHAAAPYAGAGAVLLGVPYDGGTTYQPGARLAPYAIRRVSALVQSYHPTHQVDVFRKLSALDGGNVALPPFDASLVRTVIQREVAQVVEAGAAPFVVGGDHTVALPAMRAVAATHGPLAVVHVDAHLDTSGPEVWGDAYHHGTPLRHALTEDLIERGQLWQVGLRASWGHPEEGAFAAAYGARQVGMEALERHSLSELVAAIRLGVGNRPLYVTFDVDAIDPAFAPGTGTPVPGGLSAREALVFLRGLKGLRLVGMDLVEVCPVLDHADITCHLAAALLYEGLALRALSTP